MRAFACCVALVASVGLGVGCWEQVSAGDADTAIPADAGDASVDGDAWVPDGKVADAEVLPDAAHFDFCDEPFFKLPTDGTKEETASIDVWERKLGYSRCTTGHCLVSNVFLFDIETCTERRITSNLAVSSLSIRNGWIAWNDFSASDQNPELCTTVNVYSLEDSDGTTLTEGEDCESNIRTNGSVVAFTKSAHSSSQDLGPPALELIDLATGAATEVASADQQVAYVDLSERYVAGSGYTGEPGTPGREIFWYDLTTGASEIIPSSLLYYTYEAETSEELIVYGASGNWAAPPWHLILHDIATGTDTWLANDDPAMPGGYIHRNLVTFATSTYSGGTTVRPADVALYDARSGIQRRLTTVASNLRPAGIWFPHLLLIDVLDLWPYTLNDYYVADLVALGITDADGNVIPGDGVIVPP